MAEGGGVFADKYVMICLPAITVLVAGGLVRLRTALVNLPNRAVVASAVVLVVALDGWSLARYYRSPSTENWRAAANYLETQVTSQDLVYVPSEGLPLAYYLARDHRSFPASVYPATLVDPPHTSPRT